MTTPPTARTLAATALVALLAATAVPLAAQDAPAGAPDAPRRLTVTGEARVEAVPDVATFTAGVQSEAAQAADALAATSDTMRAVFDALAAAGVAPADMQTSQLGVDPLWDDGAEGRAPRVRGYSASNMVTVRVREVSGLGALIDAVGAAGANRVFGVGFEIAEPRPPLDDARRRAVADARRSATVLAEAAGVKLVRVLSVSDGGSFQPQPAGGAVFRAEKMAVPIETGESAVQANVTVVWEIGPAE
jgi:uncharacterized protein YggE